MAVILGQKRQTNRRPTTERMRNVHSITISTSPGGNDSRPSEYARCDAHSPAPRVRRHSASSSAGTPVDDDDAAVGYGYRSLPAGGRRWRPPSMTMTDDMWPREGFRGFMSPNASSASA
ncbi:hypothetical protein O1611_g9138 [Lasiodiplodia mahajangana]|uniref:Uncharacterized protein n=1 Tax=Lasiodiplodia mahajangana TaxID=1108764 RepID=A0ACC2JAU1_9PEZI|nr:hypothetical protein O1611_g9138 [Lasiodiplodia mahajangana]